MASGCLVVHVALHVDKSLDRGYHLSILMSGNYYSLYLPVY